MTSEFSPYPRKCPTQERSMGDVSMETLERLNICLDFSKSDPSSAQCHKSFC